MKSISTLLLTSSLAVALAGCSISNKSTRTTAPVGPVQARTTEPGVIPAGTTLAIRTNETISTQEPGRTYPGQVAQDVEDQSGRILVPNGSPAELVVLETSGGGTFGTRTMALGVRSITVNGKKYTVTTETVEQRGEEGIGANRRTAEMVGGGALLGTLIGAVAGGGKGAAVGAMVGAAGGAAGQVLTRGKEVRVPAETVLTFKLDQPWRLNT